MSVAEERLRAVAEGGTINGVYKDFPVAALEQFKKDILEVLNDLERSPQWEPIAIYSLERYRGQRIAFYYPAITDAPHPSNNKIATVSTEMWHNRKPSMFMVLRCPDA